MRKSLGRFEGKPRDLQARQDQLLFGLGTVRSYAPPSRRRPRGELAVRAFEYLAAALLAVWLLGIGLSALDQMLEPPPTVILGPDGEPWP